mgnify:CR=1 FL=1
MISPCQGRHGKYLKNYSRKFHVGVLVSTWDLRHFVMPRISLCISESVYSRQSGTVLGSLRSELPHKLPLASLLQWGVIAAACHTEEIGKVIDDAMEAIEEENQKLKGVLPKNYASSNLDKDKLSDVVDLFTDEIHAEDLAKSKDLLGRTYEYCIAKFAEMEEREKNKQATK